MSATATLPLHGKRVLELGHIVAGPVTAMILAELGADVIKVERPGSGDQARYSRGNQGYFLAFNSCKRSVTLDLKSDAGRAAFLKLVATADVVVDNYAPGVLERLGLAHDDLAKVNPRIVTCGIRGFLPGPYGSRNLLDEPAQMMGGLAYMTGPPGMPLRAGASVIDIAGAMFSVIGIISALLRREETGSGDNIKTGLFETVVFVVAQHIAKAGISGEVPLPMTERGAGKDLGWGIYKVFETKDRRHVFIGVTSDDQWSSFCQEFGLDDLWAEPALRSNAGRRAQYERLTGRTDALVRTMNWQEIISHLERANIPHAPVNTPADLFDHPQLLARKHLTRLEAPDGSSAPIPGLPIEFANAGRQTLSNPPKLGEHSREILGELGYSAEEIERLIRIPNPELAA
jgi:crotonobetainyl-CoA:carnitine CoA-transferase CaiB-like acyl-CoA transferase